MRAAIVIAFVASALPCKGGSDGADAAPTATPTATATATPTATAAATATATATSDSACKVHKKRCDPACKAAHASAVATTCKAETDAMNKSVPDPLGMGKCLVACRTKGEDTSCVGPPDAAGCACQVECYKKLPGNAVENAKAAGRCYDKAVASACD
jgi:hypothetical protein